MSRHDEEIIYGEIDRPKKVRKKKHYLLRFCVVIGVLAALGAFSYSDFFLVKSVTADGNQYYSDEEIMHMAGADSGVNLIWEVDGSALKANLMENPYFSNVKVMRRLPNVLHFQVEERKQVAAVVYGEDYVVIDKNGIVLRKSDVDPKISLLTGLTISRLEMGSEIQAEEAATLELTLAMLDAMEDGDIFFKKIDVSKVVIKAYIYDTLVVKGTPKQMIKAIERGDLQKVVNNLLENETTRGTISLGNHNYMSFSPEF